MVAWKYANDLEGYHKAVAQKMAGMPKLPKQFIKGPGSLPKKIPSMKEGGMVEKTMLHHLHKGEMVVPAHLVKHFSKLMTR